VNSVLRILRFLIGDRKPDRRIRNTLTLEQGQKLLEKRTQELLGSDVPNRWVRIMVTLPSHAASDPELVRQLMEAGMNCARINGAHDTPPEWSKMINNVRKAERAAGLYCRILFDLGGSKLRTGPVARGPAVIKWRPTRDALGQVIEPARVWLTPEGAEELLPEPAQASISLPGKWLARLETGEVVRFLDTRKNRRELKVISKLGSSRWAESRKTAYLKTGTVLTVDRPSEKQKRRKVKVGHLPSREEPVLLNAGDLLVLTQSLKPGTSAKKDAEGQVTVPARIGCGVRQIFRDVRVGERIWFDDGKMGGLVEKVSRTQLVVRIDRVRPGGGKLRGDRGINLPDSRLRCPSLLPKDLKDLEFAVGQADLVGYSFVRSPDDVKRLQRELARLKGEHLGIVLKIETRAAFERLPDLLLTAMESPLVGVMIARGDLAVECGYERLAEVQEEILWMCEAAHVPVIWATQVLETMAQDGQPSRAEVTDAAMGVRAECVMLNKGPEMVATVRTLDDILTRMQAHQNKKQSMLRSLNVARLFRPASEA